MIISYMSTAAQSRWSTDNYRSSTRQPGVLQVESAQFSNDRTRIWVHILVQQLQFRYMMVGYHIPGTRYLVHLDDSSSGASLREQLFVPLPTPFRRDEGLVISLGNGRMQDK